MHVSPSLKAEAALVSFSLAYMPRVYPPHFAYAFPATSLAAPPFRNGSESPFGTRKEAGFSASLCLLSTRPAILYACLRECTHIALRSAVRFDPERAISSTWKEPKQRYCGTMYIAVINDLSCSMKFFEGLPHRDVPLVCTRRVSGPTAFGLL